MPFLTFNWMVWFRWVLRVSLCILDVNSLLDVDLQIFSPVLWVDFSLCRIVCFDVQSFTFFITSHLCIFFCYLCLWSHIQEIIAEPQCCGNFVLCFLLSFIVRVLYFVHWSALSNMALGESPTSFFCKWMSSFSNTVYWRLFFLFSGLLASC